jgi:hypothetical protein
VLALYFIFMQYIAGKFRKCEKLPDQGMYLSRSRTGNIFPYRTVVVLRHHVYVPEFLDPSCYSVGQDGSLIKNPWDHEINIYGNSILLNSVKVQYLSKDT